MLRGLRGCVNLPAIIICQTVALTASQSGDDSDLTVHSKITEIIAIVASKLEDLTFSATATVWERYPHASHDVAGAAPGGGGSPYLESSRY